MFIFILQKAEFLSSKGDGMKGAAILILICLLTLDLSAQSFSVFDVDHSNFPTVKAKFYAFDEDGDQILNLSKSDFEITENGEPRNVVSVSCPTPKPPEAISSVLTIDVSGSMRSGRLDQAKAAARAWVNAMPLGKSECAITTFNSSNYFNQDFTTDKDKLLNIINSLSAGGGTDFNAGFINPKAGALLAAEGGENKRVVVFLTDGQAQGNESAIIQKANDINATIFCVTLGMRCPQILKNVSEQTGGQWFENVMSEQQAKDIYLQVLQIAQNSDPCEIEWESGINCKSANVNVKAKFLRNGIIAGTNYQAPDESIAMLEFDPLYIRFNNPQVGVPIDSQVTVTARNARFTVTDITSSDPAYDINPKSFTLKPEESKNLTVTYTAPDSGYTYNKFTFINDVCEEYYYTNGGWSGIKPKVPTLKVTHPNGGEQFVVGSDTLITWEGIAKSDTVSIDYSVDNGASWKRLSNETCGLQYKWRNVPRPASNECLVKVSQVGGEGNADPNDPAPEIEWQKTYGGSTRDFAKSIIATPDGGYAVAGYTESNDGDVTENKGRYDYWILKLSGAGELEWQNTYGGSKLDYAKGIIATPDGGYAVAGMTWSNDGDVTENKGEIDYWILKLKGDLVLQSDTSDAVFSIVEPIAASKDINMGNVLVNSIKDSVVSPFVENTGTYKFRVDSIYIRGADASAFRLVSGLPEYEVEAGKNHFGEFNFSPKRVGHHQAEIVVITQADTLVQNITGVGVKPELEAASKVIDFGRVRLGTYKDTTDAETIKNIGNVSLEIKNTELNELNEEDFGIVKGGGNFTLAPGKNHKMTLRFEPSAVGRTSGILEFSYDGVGSPETVQLFGEGIIDHPEIAMDSPISFCEGDSVILETNEEYKSCRWSNGETTPAITVKESGTYSVTVEFEKGYKDSSNKVIVNVIPNSYEIETVSDNNILEIEPVKIGNINCRTIKIKNKSESHCRIDDIPLSRNMDFSIPQSQFPIELISGETYELLICFSPWETGIFTDTLIIQDTCSDHRIILTAEAEEINMTGTTRCGVPIQLTGEEMGGTFLEVFEPYPNPASDDVTFSFITNRKGISKIEIYDVLGNKVKSMERDVQSKGFQEISVSLDGVPAGLYVYRLSLEGAGFTRSMVVTK